MSLFGELKAAAVRDKLRLHTPGHKGALCGYDLTELTDGSFPSDKVKAACARIAEVYGAAHSFMLCGGSSQGVKSAVYFADCDGIADVNSHRSVFDGFKLSGRSVTAVGESGAVRPITAEDIRRALKPGIGAVAVTSPTYYGFCADLNGIKDLCRSRGLRFIVDSAHGAHFGFSRKLPHSAVGCCDICNVSVHKTLSALTQTALLFDDLGDGESAKLGGIVDLMGTTSPSYLLYSSIDYSVRKAEDSADAYDALYGPLDGLRREFPFLQNDDFTRLVLDCGVLGCDCDVLNAELCRRGVFAEMTDDRHIVFIFTAENTPEDVAAFGTALADGIREIR